MFNRLIMFDCGTMRSATGVTVIAALLSVAGVARAENEEKSPYEEVRGHTAVRFEAALSALYSFKGAELSGTRPSKLLPTNRSPRNFIGLDIIHVSPAFSHLKEAPLVSIDAVVFNPHLEIDFHPLPKTKDFKQANVDAFWLMERFTGSKLHITPKMVIYDAWTRFRFRESPTASIRLGHFDMPYGGTPLLSTRGGQFIVPPEVEDIGFKKDWGAIWRVTLGDYDADIALTTGTGLGIHNPNWFSDTYQGSYCFSARIGTPTVKTLQYGVSGLVGRIPLVMGDELISAYAETKWRMSVDFLWRHLTRTLLVAQVGVGQNYGRNRLSGIRPLVQPGTAIAGHILFGRSFKWLPRFDFSAQVASIWWRLDGREPTGFAIWGSDHTYALIEVVYFINNALTLRINYQHDFRSLMVRPVDDRIYITLSYYR